MSRSIVRFAKALGALAVAGVVSGCVFVPAYGPRYGYNYRPHPAYYPYY